MAMTGNHSPRHYSDNLQSRRSTRLPASSPWNQVVRGESDSVAAAPSTEDFPSAPAPVEDFSSAGESSDNGGAVKRPVWNKPSPNGAAASEVRPVMDALSWPALSESTRAAMKSEPSKGLLDGSSVSQMQGLGSAFSSSPSSQREVGDNASNNSTNSAVPTRQKSIKHQSSNASSNGGHPQQSGPQVSVAATGSRNSSSKDHTQRGGFVSNDHPQQRNSFRNRNGGAHQRGDGSHHHNYGNRRDQDWNNNRSFSGRDTHGPPRGVPRFIRPHNSAQFFHPSQMRPFGGHIGFHELAPPVVFVAAPPGPPLPPDSLRGVPFVPPLQHHPLFFTATDPQLHSKIVNQIDYYFSNENLIKDTFLRQNMDDQGWVPVNLIAGFNKVLHLTDNIQIILDAVRTSSAVEVQGDKIRRRNDWVRWIMPPPVQFSNATPDILAEQVHNIALETSNYDGAFGDLSSPLQLSNSEGTGQVGIRGSDHSISARN